MAVNCGGGGIAHSRNGNCRGASQRVGGSGYVRGMEAIVMKALILALCVRAFATPASAQWPETICFAPTNGDTG